MLHKEFMHGKLAIDIWKEGDEYLGKIYYQTASGTRNFYFDIPQDINNIAQALQSHLDTEVAKIIYEEITDRYNDTLVRIQQTEEFITSGAEVGHNTAQEILFPPFVPSVASTTTTIWNIGGTITAIWNIGATPIITDGYYDRLSLTPETSDSYISGNHLSVLSMEEYDIARENGSLHDQVYLVYNNN